MTNQSNLLHEPFYAFMAALAPAAPLTGNEPTIVLQGGVAKQAPVGASNGRLVSTSGKFTFVSPGSSVTPTNNGDLCIQITSDTSLTFKYKGSDGTVRSATLTLS